MEVGSNRCDRDADETDRYKQNRQEVRLSYFYQWSDDIPKDRINCTPF